jgi:hypothetical protein
MAVFVGVGWWWVVFVARLKNTTTKPQPGATGY